MDTGHFAIPGDAVQDPTPGLGDQCADQEESRWKRCVCSRESGSLHDNGCF